MKDVIARLDPDFVRNLDEYNERDDGRQLQRGNNAKLIMELAKLHAPLVQRRFLTGA